MAVPKKKHSKQRSRVRRTAWVTRETKRLIDLINVVTCPTCKARIQERTVCKECGEYKGKKILRKSTSDAVTVVSAD